MDERSKSKLPDAAAMVATHDKSFEPMAAGGAMQQIGPEQVKRFVEILKEYKAGKAATESRIISSENWWKLRNVEEAQKAANITADGSFKSVSGWLHNVIVSKHADAMEAFPEPNILPREEGDKGEAQILSAIIPCILEQNKFEDTYSNCSWQKLKTGTGAYKIVWDRRKLNGLGDIAIERVNLLNLYWEPGITKIQDSRYFFATELWDKDVLQERYPQLKDKLKGNTFVSAKFLYDDSVSTEKKATVIEVYYHKYVGPRRVLHYCKFVEEEVLEATENDPKLAETGLYNHGKYPYEFDPLFPIEGSPCGYGYVDICRNPQIAIDLLQTSFIVNAKVGATPRYFSRQDGAVNEDEFLDLSKPIVHVSGNLGEDSLRQIDFRALDGIYVNVFDRIINELRETSGNTETSTGTVSSGVTAASAIAALQEASGKGSRDSTLSSYRAYSNIVEIVIELIRQFYDMPRHFRIVGEYGMNEFISYSNAGIKPQHQGFDFGVDMGYRLPVFDIKVSAQKQSVYTKVSQNELALQFFQHGFFNPQMTDQALMCLDMMDFEGKDGIMQKVAKNGTIFDKLIQYMQLALMLAARAAPEMVQGLSQDIVQTMGGNPAGGMSGLSSRMFQSDNIAGLGKKENAIVENSRARANESAQPTGGRVIRERGRKK